VQSEAEAALFASQAATIVTLTKGAKSVAIVRAQADVPSGCGSVLVTPTVVLHVLVRGQIDLDVEISKCEKKLGLARMNLDKIKKIEAQPDYAETLPENVQLTNEEKRRTFEAEVANLELSKEMFSNLK